MINFNNSIKKIIGKPKRFGGKNDWDFDGVPNKKDCQPRNTMRQDKVYYLYEGITDWGEKISRRGTTSSDVERFLGNTPNEKIFAITVFEDGSTHKTRLR